jgi:hypothetical protein
MIVTRKVNFSETKFSATYRFMELFKKHTIPEIPEIPILDGEEWDLSLAIDQHQSSNLTEKVKQGKYNDANE